MLLLAAVGGAAALVTPAKIDAAARSNPMSSAADVAELTAGFSQLASFGAVRSLPLPPTRRKLATCELEELTGLRRSAFVPARCDPAPRPKKPAAVDRAAFIEQPAGELVEMTAAASLLVGAVLLSLQTNVVEALRAMEHCHITWLPVTCGAVCGSALSLLVVDAVRKGNALSRGEPRGAARREAIVQHEAGHFLLCHLLGVPVTAVHTSSWRSMLGVAPGVTFVSPVQVKPPRAKPPRAGSSHVRTPPRADTATRETATRPPVHGMKQPRVEPRVVPASCTSASHAH